MNDAEGQAAISAIDLTGVDLGYRIGETALLRGVGFHLRAGTITGLLGPNGSGKSTLLRHIVGALPRASGALVITEDGTSADVAAMRRRDRARRLALVEQDARSEVVLPVRDVVGLGRIPHQGRLAAAGAEDESVVTEAMERAGVAGLADRVFDTLSGGERQRVQLARALAQHPRVLLLDEPTNHLDLAAQLHMVRLVRDVADSGVAVLVALHDLAQAAELCDDVLVLDAGAVTTAGPPARVLTPALLAAVWGVRGEWVRGETGQALVVSAL